MFALKIIAGIFFLPFGLLAMGLLLTLFSKDFRDNPYKAEAILAVPLVWATFLTGAYSLFVDWSVIVYALILLFLQTIFFCSLIVIYLKRFHSGAATDSTVAIMASTERSDPSIELSIGLRSMAGLMALRRKLGGPKLRASTHLENFAKLVESQERDAATEPLYQEALAIARNKFGDDHPETATAIEKLADRLAQLGKRQEAQALLYDALKIRRSAQGETHPDTLLNLNRLMVLTKSEE